MEAQRGEVSKGDKVHKLKSVITVKDPVIPGKGMGPASAFPEGLKAPTQLPTHISASDTRQRLMYPSDC